MTDISILVKFNPRFYGENFGPRFFADMIDDRQYKIFYRLIVQYFSHKNLSIK